jgi:hypothetical protein
VLSSTVALDVKLWYDIVPGTDKTVRRRTRSFDQVIYLRTQLILREATIRLSSKFHMKVNTQRPTRSMI